MNHLSRTRLLWYPLAVALLLWGVGCTEVDSASRKETPSAPAVSVVVINEIRLLLGLPPGDVRRGLSLTAQPFPPEIPAGLPAALLERRPDIRQAEEVLVAANAQIGAAKALYFPTFSLTGFLGLESDDLKDFVSASARTWSIGIGLLQPIFNAGRIRSFNEAAAARHLQTLAQYEQTIQTAFREVSDALVGSRKTREQRVQQQLLVEALADSAALANIRFVEGIDSYLQVLDAERQLFDAELELTRVQTNELLNIVQMCKALGGGWQPDQPTAGAAARASGARPHEQGAIGPNTGKEEEG